MNPIEREFFELFCQVDGVGVKKALRAMVRPVQEVAALIEEQDAKGLAALPGVGPATAERIIAKLRRKVPKFALLVARDLPDGVATERDVRERNLRRPPRRSATANPTPAACSTTPWPARRSTRTSTSCSAPSTTNATAADGRSASCSASRNVPRRAGPIRRACPLRLARR